MSKHNNQEESQHSVFLKSLFCGAAGGLIWGIVSSIAYFFSFSEVSHASFILRSFFSGSWTEGILGEVISLLILIILGIIPALIYYFLFKKLHGIMPGVMFGIGIWVLILIIMNPMFSYVPSITEMKSDTIVTTLCQFILYGVFVGYTISYEHHDRRVVPERTQNEA
ncbi:YqhR family membrane protein [Aquisalibacillus elongatus]|uniref:Membrane protein YqhR n=1 Tax=Aquisalibacillus elongatus TaxID=485577 RepID=A0A3N5CEK0_9BACI|nr:YqhR family membrane protein [Aquisalibacillus elongatus]RPF55651.1 membrane protein YqhR [Aquisalibacillus elongatus]